VASAICSLPRVSSFSDRPGCGEHLSDPRLVRELAREASVGLGPPLNSDELSGPNGPASTYTRVIEYNTAAPKAGMLKN
jgi:zinc/manganese transport system substrate-binding protein